MRVGTRSLLFGAHAFWLHPWFVALAWWRLFGFPFDPRLWVAFVIHDWGYWGCKSMDDEIGERHPYWAAQFARRWFPGEPPTGIPYGHTASGAWGDFLAFHSRFLAKSAGTQPSLLCWADKLAFVLQPWWLYLPLARLTGELEEYMDDSARRYGIVDATGSHRVPVARRCWHQAAQARMARAAYEGAAAHYRVKDEKINPAPKPAIDGGITFPIDDGAICLQCGYVQRWTGDATCIQCSRTPAVVERDRRAPYLV